MVEQPARVGPTRTVPRTAAPPLPEGQRTQVRAASAASAGHAHRTSFVLLLLGLLGGGMVCLLVVNTTLAANSIQIRNLQQQNATVREQVQELEEHVATARSAGAIEREAKRLGMRSDPHLVFINLHSRKIVSQPGRRAMPAAPASPAAKAHAAKPKSRHPARPGAGRAGQGRTGQ